jgi:hypothetical protein
MRLAGALAKTVRKRSGVNIAGACDGTRSLSIASTGFDVTNPRLRAKLKNAQTIVLKLFMLAAERDKPCKPGFYLGRPDRVD